MKPTPRKQNERDAKISQVGRASAMLQEQMNIVVVVAL